MKKIYSLAGMLAALLALAACAPNAHAVTANIYSNSNVKLVEQSAVPASVTGTTTETYLSVLNIPGNSMYLNGAMRVHLLVSTTNNANAKTVKLYLGGQLILTGGLTSVGSGVYEVWIANRNATNSQVWWPSAGNNSFGTATASAATGAIDMSKDKSMQVSCTLAVSTDTCTVEQVSVEILNP